MGGYTCRVYAPCNGDNVDWDAVLVLPFTSQNNSFHTSSGANLILQGQCGHKVLQCSDDDDKNEH